MELGNNMVNRSEARAELARASLLFNPPTKIMVTNSDLAQHIVARCLSHPDETLQVSEEQLRRAFGQEWDARQIYTWASTNSLCVIELDPTRTGSVYKFKAIPSTNDKQRLQTLAEPQRTEDT